MELLEKTYRLDIADKKMLERQFRFLAQVVAQVSVKRLYLPDDLSALPAVREVILRDIHA